MFHRPIGELLESMTATELDYWLYVIEHEYVGDERSDYRAGIVAAAVANYAGKSLKDDIYRSPVDFMDFLKREEVVEDVNAKIETTMHVWAAASGVEIVINKKGKRGTSKRNSKQVQSRNKRLSPKDRSGKSKES